MNSRRKSQALILFYILICYTLLQLLWWGYQLIQLNNIVYSEEASKRTIMILGEGADFLVLMIIGIIKLKKTIQNEMEVNQQQKNFLLSVTHELKSPLASIKLYLQTLERRNLPEEKKAQIISNALLDTDRLDSLIEKILTATSIDDGKFEIHKEQNNLSEFVNGIINQKKNGLAKNHHLNSSIDNNISFSFDTLAMHSIVSNLIENAVKYSPKESIIDIALKQDNDFILFSVKDEGKGVPDEQKKSIFNRFYRGEDEETRQTKGTGLGLYLVKNLVLQHQGNIQVLNNSPKGSLFEIKFSKN